MKIKMVTVKANRYGGRRRVIGDPLEVDRRHVKVVQALGWARPVEPGEDGEVRMPAKPRPQAPKPRGAEALEAAAVPAQSEPVSEPAVVAPALEPETVKPKREYKRRDLTAEGTGS